MLVSDTFFTEDLASKKSSVGCKPASIYNLHECSILFIVSLDVTMGCEGFLDYGRWHGPTVPAPVVEQ